MPGPAPKRDSERRRTNKPATPWVKTTKVGWQHGKIPSVPSNVTREAGKTWRLWFGSWWASWWSPEDVPQIELALRLWDRVNSGDVQAASNFRGIAEHLGITPKGRHTMRWLAPEDEEEDTSELASVRRLRVTDAAS